MTEDRKRAGGCLCGAVRYRLLGEPRDVIDCHCGQCRRIHGHHAAYTAVKKTELEFERDEGLVWYQSSENARRGFCGTCGSSLFWDPRERGYMAVAAGCLDAPTGLKTTMHIYVADKSDYYEILDGLPQEPGTQMD
jgi:hypothetical protein